MARSKRSVEKEEFWRWVLDEYASSGLSIRAFCRREAIAEASFYFWRRELTTRDQQPSPTSNPHAMIPVRVVEKTQHSHQHVSQSGNVIPSVNPSMVEIGIPGGFTFRADTATDIEQATAWLAAIAKVAGS